MGWTAPRSWSADKITDDVLNTEIRDNVMALKDPPTEDYSPAYASGTVATTSSAAWANVHANLVLTITTTGGDIFVHLSASGAVANIAYLDFTLDGSRQGGNDGIIAVPAIGAALGRQFIINWLLTDVPAGLHTIALQWKSSSGAIAMDIPTRPQFFAREMS